MLRGAGISTEQRHQNSDFASDLVHYSQLIADSNELIGRSQKKRKKRRHRTWERSLNHQKVVQRTSVNNACSKGPHGISTLGFSIAETDAINDLIGIVG